MGNTKQAELLVIFIAIPIFSTHKPASGFVLVQVQVYLLYHSRTRYNHTILKQQCLCKSLSVTLRLLHFVATIRVKNITSCCVKTCYISHIKVLKASNILVINCCISGYCYILRQKLLHHFASIVRFCALRSPKSVQFITE